MSQEKVEKRKQEKYGRKTTPKQSNIKKFFSYAGVTVVAAVIIIYFGYSIAIETGLYTPPETTTAFVSRVTAEELASTLDASGDQLGYYNKAKGETATTAEETSASEEATTDTETVTSEESATVAE